LRANDEDFRSHGATSGRHHSRPPKHAPPPNRPHVSCVFPVASISGNTVERVWVSRSRGIEPMGGLAPSKDLSERAHSTGSADVGPLGGSAGRERANRPEGSR